MKQFFSGLRQACSVFLPLMLLSDCSSSGDLGKGELGLLPASPEKGELLIEDQFVVMAAHYTRPANVPVMFHDREGKPVERYITDVRSLAPMADVAVGKLNLPVPGNIKRYRFAPMSEVKPGRAVLITDQTKTVSIHQIQSWSGRMISFSFHPQLDPVYRRNLIVGDSGNPTFIISGGDLNLLETHFYGGPGSGPCFASDEIQQAVRAAIAEMR